MKLDFARLVRPLVAAAIVASATAVGLSRIAPPVELSRKPSIERHLLISPNGVPPGGPGSLWLDAETGRTTYVDPPGGEILQYASHSPWRDKSGRFHIVGRSQRQTSASTTDPFGLVRMTFPDAQVLERVATEILPESPPCWYPGLAARVLFGACDGRLYQFTFEPTPSASGEGLAGDDPRDAPRALPWKCPPPGQGVPRLANPRWPADPRFRRTILVDLTAWKAIPGGLRLGPRRIWWLRFNPEGDAIEEAGPVFDPDPLPTGFEARTPSVVATPDGGLAVAYFQDEGRLTWSLWLAPLTFDESGHPRVATGPGERLAVDCATFPAVSSANGRWLAVVQRDGLRFGSILRLDLSARDSARMPGPKPAGEDFLRSDRGRWALVVSIVRSVIGLAIRATTSADIAA